LETEFSWVADGLHVKSEEKEGIQDFSQASDL
jgi:hypothetical protein